MKINNKNLDSLRTELRKLTLTNEKQLVEQLITQLGLLKTERHQIQLDTCQIIETIRTQNTTSSMELLLAEYGLSTNEGIALMCLAEALLRVPDNDTIDDLIRDKISAHDWASHLNRSSSIMVNASSWALLLTGEILSEHKASMAGILHQLTKRLGEPVIRKAVGIVMRQMARQFVLEETIPLALKRAQGMMAKGYYYSYDMLGEAAVTANDADFYFKAYYDAIQALSHTSKSTFIQRNPSISVKLSALFPRYELTQQTRAVAILTERLRLLCELAMVSNMGLNIDAEESERLDLSLEIITALMAMPSLRGWNGLGVVVQAYGKRAYKLIEWLYHLAKQSKREIMVRLVKGAYWDREIKQAQSLGLDNYPVFTRKAHSDVSYLACAKLLLTMTDQLYPQFATHNAHSIQAILHMAKNRQLCYEFQRLHGMGENLYDILMKQHDIHCRIYAPVGAHRDLLAYLVRRLLENGANSSFVHQIINKNIPAQEIAADPVTIADKGACKPNPKIPLPKDIFKDRLNAKGWNIQDETDQAILQKIRATYQAPFLWDYRQNGLHGDIITVFNPASNNDKVGYISFASKDDVENAITKAGLAQHAWAKKPVVERAKILRTIADSYENNSGALLALTCLEAGKTMLDSIAEIREATDFLRYYADEAEQSTFSGAPHGVIACISPWNFPLAIFTGQIAAALVTGNAVIAKPAEQTSLIAYFASHLMHQAGIPKNILSVLPGDGKTIGKAIISRHQAINGICFTGSGEVAKMIDQQLANNAPDAMLIAETGGLNCMIVDSTALMEQAVHDIVRSAFQSAGQRCSALRLLYLQDDIADHCLTMLFGAMEELTIGNPWFMETDIGPIIDSEAFNKIEHYLNHHIAQGSLLKTLKVPKGGHFIPPSVVKVTGIDALEEEIFGPILHIACFASKKLSNVLQAINDKGYGLTLGLHTRIDKRVEMIIKKARIGNIYINRDQIGAVVGSQPFGGHGLSGTGPKAGGPLYLPAFVKNDSQDKESLHLKNKLLEQSLPGPTGESNRYRLLGKGTILCLGPSPEQMLQQVQVALATGNQVIAIAGKKELPYSSNLTILAKAPSIKAITVMQPLDAIVWQGDKKMAQSLRIALATHKKIIRPLICTLSPHLFYREQTICINTTAAGGNATLLSL